MAGVSGRPTDAQDEQTPAKSANAGHRHSHAFDCRDIDLFQNRDRFRDERRGKGSGRNGARLPESFL
jgi:hypothetical protein